MIRTLVASIAVAAPGRASLARSARALCLAALATGMAPEGALAYSGGCRIAREGSERGAPPSVPPELAGLVTVRGQTARIAPTSQFGNLPITIHVRRPRDCAETPGAGRIKRR